MTHFIVRYRRGGEHIHVRLFAARARLDPGPALTGELSFRDQEWEAFLNCFSARRGDTIVVVPDDDAPATA